MPWSNKIIKYHVKQIETALIEGKSHGTCNLQDFNLFKRVNKKVTNKHMNKSKKKDINVVNAYTY